MDVKELINATSTCRENLHVSSVELYVSDIALAYPLATALTETFITKGTLMCKGGAGLDSSGTPLMRNHHSNVQRKLHPLRFGPHGNHVHAHGQGCQLAFWRSQTPFGQLSGP